MLRAGLEQLRLGGSTRHSARGDTLSLYITELEKTATPYVLQAIPDVGYVLTGGALLKTSEADQPPEPGLLTAWQPTDQERKILIWAEELGFQAHGEGRAISRLSCTPRQLLDFARDVAIHAPQS